MTDTQTIKDRIDIVQFIQEYVPLKKAGANWKAPCPFHHEKSPSFMVHADKQIWHCFGCGKGGDVFSFVQEIEGMEFPEALKLLADRAGVKLERQFQNEVDKSQKNRLLEINNKAMYFFHHVLTELPQSEEARQYLAGRGVTDATIADWQIGFVPEQWDLLTRYLLKKGFGIDDLVVSGLTIKRDGADAVSGRGYYDRFRGRIMFPLSDAHGNVVGFTGRVLKETETSGGKYVNSPQSPIYDKSRVLFGLHKAKTTIKSADLAVVVEGQMDVISCHQAGMKNVVAASGTALTPEQVRILKRYTDKVAMAFDADNAGQEAAKRGIAIAIEAGLKVKVIRLPDSAGKDADECIKKDPSVWFAAVTNATDVMSWYFAREAKRSVGSPSDKQAVVDALLPEIMRIPFAVERDEWLRKLADRTGVTLETLREETKRMARTAPKQPVAQTAAPTVKKPSVLPTDRITILAGRAWALAIKFPSLVGTLLSTTLETYFAETPFVSLYQQAKVLYTPSQTVDITDRLRAYFFQTGQENVIDILLLQAEKDFAVLSEVEAKAELTAILFQLHEAWLHRRRKELQLAIADAEAAKDNAALTNLLQEFQQLK